MPKPTFFSLPDDKQARIIEAAVDEFAAQGYAAASISQIVAAAGIAKGSFYQYFEDKADLYRHLLAEGRRVKAEFDRSLPIEDAPREMFAYLRWLLRVGVQYEAANPKLARIAYAAFNGDGPDSAAFRAQTHQMAAAFALALIEQGIASGALDPAVDRDAAAFILTQTFANLSNYVIGRLGIEPEDIISGRRQHEIEAAVEGVLTILQRGMGKPS